MIVIADLLLWLRKLLPSHQSSWQRKQALAAPGRYYGGTRTIHGNQHLDVEVHEGEVVAVWFRCQLLPFHQTTVGSWRVKEIRGAPAPMLTGVEVMDHGSGL